MKAPIVLAFLLAACGGGGGGDDTADVDCGLTVDLSGGVTASLDYGADSGCAGSGFQDQLALSLGVDQQYIVYLEMTGVTAGSTPGSASASLEVVDSQASPSLSWKTGDTDCTLTITSDTPDDLGGYGVVGTGSCAAPAVARDGNTMPDITVNGTFAFSAGAAWSQ